MDSSGVGGTLYLLLWLFAIIVLVLWVLLPFAVFGMKPLLREAVREQAETRRVLERLLAAVERNQPAPASAPASALAKLENYKPNWPD
jgi:hypothetical protein